MSDLTHAIWRKSSRSTGTGQCVEVARNLSGVVAIRDSKDTSGPALVIDSTDWTAFVASVRDC